MASIATTPVSYPALSTIPPTPPPTKAQLRANRWVERKLGSLMNFNAHLEDLASPGYVLILTDGSSQTGDSLSLPQGVDGWLKRILLPSSLLWEGAWGPNGSSERSGGGGLARRAAFFDHYPPVTVFAPTSPNNLEYLLAVSKNLAHPLHPVHDDGKGGGWKWWE